MIRVDAGGWGATYAADESGRLHQIALGPQGHTTEATTDTFWYPDAYPCWGDSDPFRTAALRVTHHDGTLTTRLRFESTERHPRDDGREGIHTTITCLDELFELGVTHHFLTHPSSGVLETWTEIVNGEQGPVTLHDYDSVSLAMLVGTQARLTQFGGSGWADEWRWSTHGLDPGLLTLASLGGVQPHLQRAPFLLLDTAAGESAESAAEGNDTEVLGFSIQWMGNTRFTLDVRPAADPGAPRLLSLRAGANPYGADYVLDPGCSFVTPSVAWTWSSDARRGVTRSFHHWTREVVLREPQRLRPIVVNNWEATEMAFDEARLVDLIDRAGALGAEVFLLDDGWFGTTYPRDDDTQGLGDWDPDPAKLPNGFDPLVHAAQSADIRFGTWVEPEMVNPRSDLFEAHPDWVVRDARNPREHRQQLVLDPTIDAVAGFEIGVFEQVLGGNPGISYLKWDANRPITDPGSRSLPADRQANLWVDNVAATWALMDDVVARQPEVELMLCASGGGRNDHGTLRRFHEFWTSDNTDPVARVRMQWACSHFFPASVMAAHVTRWGERPLEFACAVALSGRFGFDIDLAGLSEDELDVCRRAVALAKRNATVIQQGWIEHLVSPVEGDDLSRAAVAYDSNDATRCVVFAYQLEDSTSPPPRIHPAGLERSLTYEVTCTDLTSDRALTTAKATGAELTTEGLQWPLATPCTARIWEITASGE